MSTVFDIVVPIHNSLHHVRSCLKSIAKYSPQDYHLFLVNDGSDNYVVEQIQSLLAELIPADRFTILHNDGNKGYLYSVNRGIRAGSSPYVVLLNSDTVVTPGWLEGLRRCVDSANDIGCATPLSNHANFTRVEFPDGYTWLDMAAHVSRYGKGVYPEIGIGSGFCFIVKRAVYEQVGLYDPIYGPGYYEESDWCMRAYEAGYRSVAVDNVYIFHNGWGTFGASGRNEWIARNKRIFERRWGRAHDLWKERFLSEKPFGYLEQSMKAQSPRPVVAVPVPTFKGIPKKNSDTLPTYKAKSVKEWRALAQRVAANARRLGTGTSRPKVLYLLPGVGYYGGIISVFQLVNRLLFEGFDAQVATYGGVDESFKRETAYFRPYVFESRTEMFNGLGRYDLVVSTRWDTVYDALLLAEGWNAQVVSFVQDFEADTYPPESEEAMMARLSLELVDHKICKSHWLHDKLVTFGGHVHRIPIGLNLDIFYPANSRSLRRPYRIVSAARPGAPHRNFEGTLAIFRELCSRRNDVLPTFYGKPFTCADLHYEHMGVLSQCDVAKLLRESAVLIDASLFQGFGRPGLEAMACGIPAVLTTEGGINEYAKHGVNCLQVDPTDVGAFVSAIETILNDHSLADRLVERGLQTAREYDADVEAKATARLFRSLLS